MRIGANDAVREEPAVVVEHDAGQVLEVHLVNDARTRRNYQHVLEGFRSPLQERAGGKNLKKKFFRKIFRKMFVIFCFLAIKNFNREER